MKRDSNEYTFDTEKWLSTLAINKDILCLWLDCDREGENICYEVIFNTYERMNERKYQQIYRAIFSSLTKKDITEAFEKIENYPDNIFFLNYKINNTVQIYH